MKLHEYLRGDLRAMDALLEEMEDAATRLRSLLTSVRCIADDLQTLEEAQATLELADELRSIAPRAEEPRS